MKKTAALLLVLAVTALTSCASKDPVADGKELLTEITGILTETTAKLSAAASEQEVKSALLSFSANSTKTALKIKTYEFKNSGKNIFTDPEFQKERQGLYAIAPKFTATVKSTLTKYPDIVPTEDIMKALSTVTGQGSEIIKNTK